MKNISRPYILIREFKRGDEIPRRDLLKQYAMSFAFDAFLSCLFREVSRRPPPPWTNQDTRIDQTDSSRFVGIHSIDCLDSGCDVHILRFAIARLSVSHSVCDYFPLRFHLFHILQQSHWIGIGKYNSLLSHSSFSSTNSNFPFRIP